MEKDYLRQQLHRPHPIQVEAKLQVLLVEYESSIYPVKDPIMKRQTINILLTGADTKW